MCYQLKKRILNPWIILILVGLAGSCKTARNDLELTKFLIDSIQSQAIPDSRTEVFSIKAFDSGQGILLTGKTTSQEALNRLTDQLKIQKVDYTDSIIRLPDAALGDKTWGLVTISVANLRYTPANSAELASQALLGTPVKVLQEEEGWYLVQTPDNYIAWTQVAGISRIPKAELDRWKGSERLIYVADNGLITDRPESGSRPVSDIVMGSIVESAGGEMVPKAFAGIILPDGRKGFVRRSDCRPFSEWCATVAPDTAAVVRTALNLMGRPYLWGGTSIKGLDCSGFTKTIYLTCGLILSRDASQQVLQGTEIPAESVWRKLLPGDLLFFGNKATAEKAERATHVGMYIGNSEFIQSSVSYASVSVNSLDSTRSGFKPYYRNNFLHVRRIIHADLPVSFRTHPWYN